MAEATTIAFNKLRILLGDGASPETFSAPCGFSQRSLNRVKTLKEDLSIDCDDEDAPAWKARTVESLEWSVTGEGVLPQESIGFWEAFFASGDSVNVRIEMLYPSDTRFFLGKAHLANYTVGANRGEKVTMNIDLQGDGELAPILTT